MSSSSEEDVTIPFKRVKRRHPHRVTSLDAEKQKVNLYSHKILPKLGALPKNAMKITEEEGYDCVPFVISPKASPAKSSEIISQDCGLGSPSASSSDSNQVIPPTPPPPFNPTRTGRHSRKAKKLLKEVSTVLSQVAELDASQESLDLAEEPIDLIKETVVKVRLRGKLHKFPVEDYDSFNAVFQNLSKKVKVDASRLLVTFGDRRVYPSDTPAGIHLTIADILECTVAQQRLAPDIHNTIRIQMQGPFSKRKVAFSMGYNETFKAVMDEYAKSNKANLHELLFRFDGDSLDPMATPRALEMDNGDCIDVMRSTKT